MSKHFRPPHQNLTSRGKKKDFPTIVYNMSASLLFFLLFSFFGSCSMNSDHDVDRISNIETDSTQIVISTSKNGPIDQLKIHIELIDIIENKKVNPVDLAGLWLTITRGRYTIPFLRPDTWYGVRFHSENVLNGVRVAHDEERLVRTEPRKLDDPKYDVAAGNDVDVKIHRSLDGVETYESVYVTVSWKGKSSHSNHTSGIVNLRVICENTETKETIKLSGNEDSVTIEITMDQKYDIEEVDTNKHQIKARITPLKCHQICWDSHLELHSQFGDFRTNLSANCDVVSGAISTTYLRNINSVHVIDHKLIVETEVAESEYGVVRIVLNPLTPNTTQSPIIKSFDTATSNGKFIVDLGEEHDDTIYTVDYEYLKTKPFHFSSSSHFLAELPAFNSTRLSHPLIEIATTPTTFDYKRDKPNSVLKPEPPFLLLSRSMVYTNDMILNIAPFCGTANSTMVRLEDRYPQHQIDAVPLLCGIQPKMYFCDKNQTYTKCSDPTFCFSTTLLVKTHSYGSEMRCLNMTQHFGELVAASTRQWCCWVFISFLCFFHATQ